MFPSSLSAKKLLPRFLGTATSRAASLRWSSSALDRHDLLYPSPKDSSSSYTSKPASATPAQRPVPSHVASTLRPLQSLPQPLPIHNSQLPHYQNYQTPTGHVTSSSLLDLVRDLAETPWSPPTPSADLAALLAGEGSLTVTGTREEVNELARRLMEAANSLDGALVVADWILRVTEERQQDDGVKVLLYQIVHELNFLLSRINPHPLPNPILKFLLINKARIRLSFSGPVPSPLIGLLETYTRLYSQDRRRTDLSAAAPTSNVLAELESLRLQHLAAVRAIHQAMKEVDKDVFTVRSYTSLMDAYKWGSAFEDLEEVWKLMRSEGGVGINQRSVSVYFDACGFSGSLPRALATWEDLRTSGFDFNEMNHRVYNHALARCGHISHLSEEPAAPDTRPHHQSTPYRFRSWHRPSRKS